MDNSTKKLLNGSAVYFMGSALTQLVSLLLMRFVTGNIAPEEYGFFNLVTTIANLAVPFLTLQMADAVYRFVLKAENGEEKKSYISVCAGVMIISVALIFVITYGISFFYSLPHTGLVALYVASYALVTVYQKIVRCLNHNMVFVTGNLIKTTIFLLLEVLLISLLDMGIEALLLAHIISTVVLLLYSEIRVRAYRFVDLRLLRAGTFKKMVRYSAPLMPNAAFWWLTSSVNNVIVSARLGIGVNGIYTVSNKFSSVLNMVTNVLNMSWQDTAVSDYGNAGFGLFLTKTFNSFIKLIFSIVAVLLPFVAVVLPYMIDPSYYGAISYTPFLLLASATSFMSGFMAQIFTGKGKTTTILITSIFGMVANILVVALLIGKIGLWAAVLGSLVSDCVLMCSRTFLARKEFAKGIAYKSFLVIIAMVAVSIWTYFKASVIGNLVWLVISAVIAVILNWEFIKNLLTLLLGRFRHKKG